MAENTDAMAAAMAETVNPNPPEKKRCDCCGIYYQTPQAARFSWLTTNGVNRRICGDCVNAMWKARAYYNQPESPIRLPRWSRWLRR